VESTTVSGTPGGILVEAKALTRLDNRNQAQLLHPTDFKLCNADRVSITGASGSGKSVLLRTLALLDVSDSGQVLWRGEPISSGQIPRYRRRICYIAQRPALIEGTVEDNLRFPYSLKTFNGRRFDRSVVEALLAQAGKEQGFLSKRAGDLSGGEAQVVALIRTLQLDPDVMLLDEPTAALDPASSREVESLVQTWFDSGAQARAFIWVTHDPEQAQRMCTTRLTMSAGRLSGASQP